MSERSAVDRVAIFLTKGFGVGNAKFAPGTWGSLLGLPVAYLIRAVALGVERTAGGGAFTAVAVGGLTWGGAVAVGYWATARTERVLQTHDDPSTVMDEILGQAIAASVVPVAIFPYVIAFGLFRLFDIWKPSLIGKIDRDVPGPWGTLGDDLLAGAVVAVLLAWVPWEYASSIVPAFFSQWT